MKKRPFISGATHLLIDFEDDVEDTWSGSLPAITPTAGAELLVNGDFSAWSADNPTGWTVQGESGSDPMITQVAPGGGAGTGAAKFLSTADAANPRISQTVMTLSSWVQVSVVMSAFTSGVMVAFDNNGVGALTMNSVATWMDTFQVTSPIFMVRVNAAPTNAVIDNVSVKALSSITSLRSMGQANGIFTNQPTRTAGTQAGVIHFVDNNNYVLAYLGLNNLILIKVVGGALTQLTSTPFTYSAGANLALQRTGPSGNGLYSVTYNGVVVIAATSLGNATFDALMAASTQWGNFSTFAANTFGTQSWTGPHDTYTYQQHIIQVVGPALINYLPLNDASGLTAVDPQTGRNWTYGASNVSSGTGVDGNAAAVFGGAAAGQVVPTAGALTALNGAGVFNPLEGTLALWFFISSAEMSAATLRQIVHIGVDGNNRFQLYKNTANTIFAGWNIGGVNVTRQATYTGGSFAHLAMTWSQSLNKLRAYLNGVQMSTDLAYSGTWAGTLVSAGTQLASGFGANYLLGTEQYWFFANRALLAAEVAALAKGATA